MKTLTKADNLLEIRDNFSEITVSGVPVLLWQLKDDGSRIIQPVFMKEMIGDDQLLIQTATPGKFELKNQTVYFHIATHKIIFKSEIDELEERFARVKFPNEVKFIPDSVEAGVDEDLGLQEFTKYIKGHGLGNHISDIMRVAGEGRANQNRENLRTYVAGHGLGNIHTERHMRLNTYNATEKISTKWSVSSMSSHDSDIFQAELDFVSLDEEDKLFADQRESVRVRPKGGKVLTIKKRDEADEEEIYPLFDLSQGGLSFLVTDKERYTKGNHILVMAFDEKRFDTPMQAQVMSIREADEFGVQFKVGCAFITE